MRPVADAIEHVRGSVNRARSFGATRPVLGRIGVRSSKPPTISTYPASKLSFPFMVSTFFTRNSIGNARGTNPPWMFRIHPFTTVFTEEAVHVLYLGSCPQWNFPQARQEKTVMVCLSLRFGRVNKVLSLACAASLV